MSILSRFLTTHNRAQQFLCSLICGLSFESLTMTEKRDFASFADFYPFYLEEHGHPVNRRLHFIGTSLVLLILVSALVSGHFVYLWLLPLVGYGFAWVGHFFIEKNRPATFQHPFYSLMGDFVMFKDILIRRIVW